ncbi:MAG TPA: D-alanine--D-alanine ligase [Eudoraea sp.]|nr:D-alanine--D-alanine ligase [Eudoraea sp.]
MKKNIAIIMGGYSSEYKISLKSGNVVYQYLNKEKFNACRVHIFKNRWVYVDDQDKEYAVNRHDFTVKLPEGMLTFDCVFNAIHGTPGEDGLMQAYFALLGIPQTSCDHYQSALTFNKRDLLSVLKPYGIPCATSYYLNSGDLIDEDRIIEKVGLPCFVKANKAGSSFGITKVYESSELKSAIDRAYEEDDEILIESFLNGTEVSVGVIRHHGETLVLPVTEIVTENDFFDYEAKYEGKSREITPARITKIQEENVVNMARQVYDILKMRGFSRSEFIFIGDEPHMLEMNTTPGLTEESILPQQAGVAGISLPELFEGAIAEALDENK